MAVVMTPKPQPTTLYALRSASFISRFAVSEDAAAGSA